MSTSDEHQTSATTGAAPHRFGEGAVSGASVILIAKVFGLAVSFGTIAIVARKLTPEDYGVVAMVTSITALFLVFSDFGLTLVTVQRPKITQAQLSTLFWVNVAFGTLLGLLTAGLGPVLAWFYDDPRLLPITLLLASMFPVLSLGLQHQALLKRNMKFIRLSLVRLSGTTAGAIVSITLALCGFGYWALVWQLIGYVIVQTVCSFLAWRWLPGRPSRCEDLRSMLGFGGYLSAHGLVGYLASNVDKVLLGRFCGPAALGLYANAFNVMTRPITLAAHSVGEAAIPAMSRSATTPDGMTSVYLRTFSLTCLLGLPACVVGILWADDVVLTLFGVQWTGAIVILRILFIAAIPRLLVASTGWVYIASGKPRRMLIWQLIWSPLVIAAFAVGLQYGAQGVATGLAIAHWIAFIPGFVYCFRDTPFRAEHVWRPALAPMIAAAVAASAALVAQRIVLENMTPGALRLVVRTVAFTAIYTPLVVRFVPVAGEAYDRIAKRLGWARNRSKVAATSDAPSPNTQEVP